MTSLIFGSIYMTHQGIVAHRRGKKREKNYQRWEDLRDEYDEQKKITRETRSLDLQRTGAWEGGYNGNEYGARDERPILTLRDQQEANDARLSWRPQEQWEPSHRPSNNPFETGSQPHRSGSVPAVPQYYQQPQPQPQPQYQPPQQQAPPLLHTASTPSAYWQSRGEIRPQRTGATWDDGLPAPLPVTRRSFEEYDYSATRRGSAPVQQTQQQQQQLSRTSSLRHSTNVSNVPSRTSTPAQIQSRVVPDEPSSMDDLFSKLASTTVEPVHSHVPGGRMAQLIERGY